MKILYTPILALLLMLMPCAASSGDLEGAVNLLENMADAARSADNAQEALKDVMRGAPRYRHQYAYDNSYYDDDYYQYERERNRHYRKMEKERAKAWRKKVKHWRKHHHHHDDDWDD